MIRKTTVFFCLSILMLQFFSNVYAETSLSEKHHLKPTSLSLEDAVLLAVRSNPNVQSSKLSYLSSKFNLWIEEWEFMPHYALQAGMTSNRNHAENGWVGGHNYNVQPAVTLKTSQGGEFILSGTNSKTINYNPGVSLKFVQPLMRGFGQAIVQSSLNNARDSLIISKLMIEATLRETITGVINAYLDVVSAERKVMIDADAVKRAKVSVEQTKIFIKAGHKAGNELVTVEANVASAKAQLENDKNFLAQSRYGLLNAIGLDPNSNIKFSSLNVEKLIHLYHFPSLSITKKQTLNTDVQYQTELITLEGEKQRSLMLAQDNARWKLDLQGEVSSGNASGKGQNAGLNSLFNGLNQAQSISLALNIPIDDQQAKQAVLNAKLALQQARLALMQDKWSKETNAINNWHSVTSAERALSFAQAAEILQEKTYNVSYQKYLHGLIDSLELQSALISLIDSKQVLLNAKIYYLKTMVNLDKLVGNTLKTWQVGVRLS